MYMSFEDKKKSPKFTVNAALTIRYDKKLKVEIHKNHYTETASGMKYRYLK